DRAERIGAMVGSTEPLVRLLSRRLGRDGLDHKLDHAPMLEVLMRRYYGNKGLVEVRTSDAAGCRFVVADRAGSRLVSTAVGFDEFGDALRGLAAVAGARPDEVDADVYLAWEKQPEDSDALAEALHAVIDGQELPGQVRRLTATVAGGGGAVMHHHFT